MLIDNEVLYGFDNKPHGNVSDNSAEFIYNYENDKELSEYNEEEKDIFVRNNSLVCEVQEELGRYCLHPECKNTFIKPDKKPYIEVHHITPLHNGGKDEKWNLVVICSHHNKMAHFAENYVKDELQKIFYEIVAKHYGY